jgi:hypothetical protein
LQEAKQIIKSLSKFVNGISSNATKRPSIGRKNGEAVTKNVTKDRKSRKAKSSQSLSMSETKRQEIIDHFNKQLSARPKRFLPF